MTLNELLNELNEDEVYLLGKPEYIGKILPRKELLCKYEICTCKIFEQDPNSFANKCKICGKYDPKTIPEENRLGSQMEYEKTFEELKIGDSFETGSGIWIVWDKGQRSLIAYKEDKYVTSFSVLDDEHVIFYDYDFPKN